MQDLALLLQVGSESKLVGFLLGGGEDDCSAMLSTVYLGSVETGSEDGGEEGGAVRKMRVEGRRGRLYEGSERRAAHERARKKMIERVSGGCLRAVN